MQNVEHFKNGARSLDYQIESVIQILSERKDTYDQIDRFPHENYDLIIKHGLHTITLASEFGGDNYGFEQTSDFLISLASECSSTALCLAMHYYTLASLNDVLSYEQKEEIFSDIWINGQFSTSFNQPNVSLVQAKQDFNQSTGISIQKVNNGYFVNGAKRYVTGIKRAKFLPIFGNQEDNVKSRLGMTALLLRVDDPGVEMHETWKYASMRSSISHDVSFKNVFVEDNRLIGREGFGIEDTSSLSHWSRLAISSVYLGIANAAIDYVLEVVKRKKDPFSKKPIAFLPGTQFTISDLKIKYEVAKNQLKMFAKQADDEGNNNRYSDDLFQKGLITKYFVGKTVNEIVWQSMQIEGMSSMNQDSKLEKLYRDVRAATFHQPSDDLLKEILAKKTIGFIAPRNRWL